MARKSGNRFCDKAMRHKKGLKRGVSGVCETRRNVLELFGGGF
jgi:hypothetical protein